MIPAGLPTGAVLSRPGQEKRRRPVHGALKPQACGTILAGEAFTRLISRTFEA